jgi:hypothetical protein
VLEIVKREANGGSTIVKQVIGSFICVNVDIAKKTIQSWLCFCSVDVS